MKARLYEEFFMDIGPRLRGSRPLEHILAERICISSRYGTGAITRFGRRNDLLHVTGVKCSAAIASEGAASPERIRKA